MDASRPHLPLRGCLSRTGFDIPDPLGKNAKSPEGAFHILAERVGFEPTVRVSAHLISNQDRSTTPAPLRSLQFFIKAPCGASTPDWTPIGLSRFSPLRGACGVQNTTAVLSNQDRSTTPAPLRSRGVDCTQCDRCRIPEAATNSFAVKCST